MGYENPWCETVSVSAVGELVVPSGVAASSGPDTLGQTLWNLGVCDGGTEGSAARVATQPAEANSSGAGVSTCSSGLDGRE
jgi:hypothetical protein